MFNNLKQSHFFTGNYISHLQPTKPMEKEAAEAGFYFSERWNKKYPKIQILTVEDILAGKEVQLPPGIGTFKKAGKVNKESDDQGQLGFN